MICRLICRIIVVGLIWATVAFAVSAAPPAVSERVAVVQERIVSRVPPRLARARDKVIARLDRLKDRLFD